MFNYYQGLRYVNRKVISLKLAPDLVNFTRKWLELRDIAKGGPMRPFLYSQQDYVCGENAEVVVDCIARLENIDIEFPKIAEQVGRPDAKLMHINKSVNRSEVSGSDREIMSEMLADEIAFFNY